MFFNMSVLKKTAALESLFNKIAGLKVFELFLAKQGSLKNAFLYLNV